MAEAKVKAVFNAARRYCVDRIQANEDKYTLYNSARIATWVREEIQSGRFSGDYRWARLAMEGPTLDQLPQVPPDDLTRALDTARVLQAILTEIERRVADDFPNVAETRAFLVDAGRRAKFGQYLAQRKDGEITWHYQEEELGESRIASREEVRSQYLEYVVRLQPEEAARAPAVPFRQVMSDSKRRRVGTKLAERWDVDPLRHYWYPLHEEIYSSNALALQDWYFYQEVGAHRLSDILLRRGITRVWELNEDRQAPEYELHPNLCSFRGSERYWSSKELDWLVYTSHEASITFAGSWLVEEIKRVWVNWEQRTYSGYDYERSFP